MRFGGFGDMLGNEEISLTDFCRGMVASLQSLRRDCVPNTLFILSRDCTQ